MTSEDEKALKSLMANQDIIIKNVDKGGGVVILDREDYLTESTRILSDVNYYKKNSL